MHPKVPSNTAHSIQPMEAIYTSTGRRMDKDGAQIHTGILASHKKEQNNTISATGMDREMIIPSEVRQRQIAHDNTYKTNPWKKDTNEYINETEKDSQV